MVIHSTRSLKWWTAMFVLSLAVFSGVNTGISILLISQSQHRWCDVLQTIKPQQKTETNAPFFVKLDNLERQFGCKQ